MSDQSKVKKLNLFWPKTSIVIGFLIAVGIPTIILWMKNWKWELLGTLGDTYGGIAGPIINFISIILLFLSFKAQYESNNIQLTLIEEERNNLRDQKKEERNDKQFEMVLSELKSIDNALSSFNYESFGGDALAKYFDNLKKYKMNALIEKPSKEKYSQLISTFRLIEFVIYQIDDLQDLETHKKIALTKLLLIKLNYFPLEIEFLKPSDEQMYSNGDSDIQLKYFIKIKDLLNSRTINVN